MSDGYGIQKRTCVILMIISHFTLQVTMSSVKVNVKKVQVKP